MKEGYTVPLIIRGQVIEDNLVTFGGRRGGITFLTPDVNQYFDQIILRNPGDLRDLYDLSLSQIYDYLEELGKRLSPATNPHIRQAMEASIIVSNQGPDILRSMYENSRHVLGRERLKELVETVFGEAVLEGWVTKKLSDRTTQVRAFGARTVHINAGNGIGVALQSIMNNSILRSDAIIKNPSNDPLTATAIALTMIEMAPDHPLTKHVTVAYWKGGDEAFEKRLYKPTNIEKIIAWGGAASMEHIRAYLGPGIDLVALDPKLSSSLIGKEAFQSEESMQRAASLLAMDVGYNNQEGCINARTAYAESGTDETGVEKLNRFGRMVYNAIQALPKERSSIAVYYDPVLREEVDGLRGNPYFEVIGGKGLEGAVIVSQEDEPVDFGDRLSGRTVNIVPVARIEDAYRRITIHTQTIGIYPESLKEKVRDECARRGAQRLTSLGCASSWGLAQPHDGIEPMRRMARWLVIESFNEAEIERGSGFLFAAAA